MKKITLIIASFVALGCVSVGVWYYTNFQKYAPTTYVTDTTTGSITTNTETGTTSTRIPFYTSADVAAHADISSCYTIISDSIYDVTLFVNMHPGGKGAILSLCGKDGTAQFIKKHKGGQKYMNILARYKIGVLN